MKLVSTLSFAAAIFSLAPLALAQETAAVPVPRNACAAKAYSASRDTAKAFAEAEVKLTAFKQVAPSASEKAAGDQFFNAAYASVNGKTLKYHVIMWCKGMKSPMAMAIQPIAE